MYKLIQTERRANLGIITLNSEKTLNALSQAMFEELLDVLHKWKLDDNVACVFLQGAGERAFCAGGDVRKLHDLLVSKPESERSKVDQGCVDFFVFEYQADYLIHRYPKPIVAWLDRIVMGGGIGISNGASHRIATERSLFAMPEIAIGLYPDVGASWFLNRMPVGFGLFTGMTGARLNGLDAKFLGLATHYLQSKSKDAVLEALVKQGWTSNAAENRELVTTTLDSLSTKDQTDKNSPAQNNADLVAEFATVDGAMAFKETLERLAPKSEWIGACAREFFAGSPSSAHVIVEQLKRTSQMDLASVFRAELNLSVQCCIHPDFVEGVRALLVDKDKNPKWQPTALVAVTRDWVESYFEPLWTPEENPFRDLDGIISGHKYVPT